MTFRRKGIHTTSVGCAVGKGSICMSVNFQRGVMGVGHTPCIHKSHKSFRSADALEFIIRSENCPFLEREGVDVTAGCSFPTNLLSSQFRQRSFALYCQFCKSWGKRMKAMHMQTSNEKCSDSFNATKAKQRAFAMPCPFSAQWHRFFGARITLYRPRSPDPCHNLWLSNLVD